MRSPSPPPRCSRAPDGYYAYVIKPDQSVERRTVEVSGIQDGQAIVTAGLAAGEKIVVDGQFRLSPGAKVQVAPAAHAGRGTATGAPKAGG